jgi:hypothetical protein
MVEQLAKKNMDIIILNQESRFFCMYRAQKKSCPILCACSTSPTSTPSFNPFNFTFLTDSQCCTGKGKDDQEDIPTTEPEDEEESADEDSKEIFMNL